MRRSALRPTGWPVSTRSPGRTSGTRFGARTVQQRQRHFGRSRSDADRAARGHGFQRRRAHAPRRPRRLRVVGPGGRHRSGGELSTRDVQSRALTASRPATPLKARRHQAGGDQRDGGAAQTAAARRAASQPLAHSRSKQRAGSAGEAEAGRDGPANRRHQRRRFARRQQRRRRAATQLIVTRASGMVRRPIAPGVAPEEPRRHCASGDRSDSRPGPGPAAGVPAGRVPGAARRRGSQVTATASASAMAVTSDPTGCRRGWPGTGAQMPGTGQGRAD